MLATPIIASAGDLTVAQYFARHDQEFSGQFVNACIEKHQASSREVRLAYIKYTENRDAAVAKFLTRLGRDATQTVPNGEASIQRLHLRAAEYLRTVDFSTYCPMLAASLTAMTKDALYESLEQAWEEFRAQKAPQPNGSASNVPARKE